MVDRRTLTIHKRPFEELSKIVEELGYKLLDDYYKNNDKTTRRMIVEDIDGYKYDVTMSSLTEEKNIPARFGKGNPYTIENIIIWMKLNKRSFVLEEGNIWKNAKTNLKFRCNNCNEIFYSTWDRILAGKACGVCHGKQVGEKTSLAYLRPELIKEWSNRNNMYPTDVTLSSSKYVYWICSSCRFEWKASIISRAVLGNGCPNCASSKGEYRIQRWLLKNNISYIFEKTFSDCKDKNSLSFDFYLPKYNICIEFQGKQHYEPVDFGGNGKIHAIKSFNDRIKKDNIKEQYCKNNKIGLIIIPYWEFDNIDIILEKHLIY